jgi:glyoxylase-like metal-dependent hydrolase (beta-lactamase superfamily II)
MGRESVGRPVSRRWVVRDLGLGGFAVAVLAACSRSGSSGAGAPGGSATASSSGTGSAGTGSAGTGSASPGASGAGTAAGGASSGPDAAGALSWDRVDLGFVAAYVLVRGDQAAVVDTGTAGSADAIGAVLDRAGPGWDGVRHVILTHHHQDHAGSAADVLGRAPAAAGYVGAADLSQVTAPRLRPVSDGTEVFGLRLVATPGHTAGHMCVFDPQTGVLVAGDALTNTAGLAGSNPQFTADPQAAQASIRVLAGLPVRTVLFGHGSPLESGAAAALKDLASR